MTSQAPVPHPTVHPQSSNNLHLSFPFNTSTDPSHDRIRTYTAHALLTTTYGIPLSSGLWLEYQFTTVHSTTSLLTLSTIFAAQSICLILAATVATLLHQRWPRQWRLHMCVGGLTVCGAHLALLVAERLWVLVLCQGVFTGAGLGVLLALSLAMLSSHYKGDRCVSSAVGGAAGFLGAGLYTVMVWVCLRAGKVKMGFGIAAVLVAFTVLIAVLLAKPCVVQSPRTVSRQPPHSAGSYGSRLLAFLLALCLSTLVLPPIFLPIILTQHPTPYRADGGCYVLLALFTTASFSSALLPKLPAYRLSPTTLVSACALLAAISVVPLIWMPNSYVALPCATVFGVGMGGICPLWHKSLSHLTRGEGWVILVGGVGTACAVVGAAAVMEKWEAGVKVVLGAVVGCLGLAGLLLSTCARVRDRRKTYAQ